MLLFGCYRCVFHMLFLGGCAIIYALLYRYKGHTICVGNCYMLMVGCYMFHTMGVGVPPRCAVPHTTLPTLLREWAATNYVINGGMIIS